MEGGELAAFTSTYSRPYYSAVVYVPVYKRAENHMGGAAEVHRWSEPIFITGPRWKQ
jgi:hypothetical protein